MSCHVMGVDGQSCATLFQCCPCTPPATGLAPPSMATTIAIDGGVYAKFGGYQEMLDDCMKDVLGTEDRDMWSQA